MRIPPGHNYDPAYLQALGRIEAEWSAIETTLYFMFSALSGTDEFRAHQIYYAIQNHRTRREAVESLAFVVLNKNPRLKAKFASLMRRLRNAAGKRNEVTHSGWFWFDGKPRALFPIGSDLMKTRNLMQELQTRARTLEALQTDLFRFLRKHGRGIKRRRPKRVTHAEKKA